MLLELSQAIEARDPFSSGHAARVTRLALEVARRLGWDLERIDALELGGRLHDIGKLAVPEEVLCKPTSLTEAELEEVRSHPAVGARLLESIAGARTALPCVLYHHERWDGGGYPTGLAGEEIPVEARLLAVADAYDAMTSSRAYRPALAPERAVAELERCSGTQFDPGLVGAFVEVWGVVTVATP